MEPRANVAHPTMLPVMEAAMADTKCTLPDCDTPRFKSRLFCSRHYMKMRQLDHPSIKPRQPRPVRFWAKVQKTENCWEWRGSIKFDGYGSFDGNQAHIWSWVLNCGPVPSGLWVLHTCDNRKCVRPSHLYLGTAKDNSRDRDIRHRTNHRHRTLTAQSVKDIRALYAEGHTSLRELAALFGVSSTCIHLIVIGKTWAGVT